MKNLKGFIVGLLVGIIMASVPIFADSYQKTIEAVFNKVSIAVDGVDMESDNILYDGKTYVWIRDAANILGKEVNWDGEENKVYIGKMPVKDNTVLATVGDSEITMTQFNTLQKMMNQNTSPSDIVDELIALKVYENKAKELNVDAEAVKSDMIMPYIEGIKGQYGEEVFTQQLQGVGLTEEEYINLLIPQASAEEVQKIVFASYEPTEDEYSAEYEKQKDSYYTATAKHILLKTTKEDGTEMTENEIKKVEVKANDIYNAAKRGTSFDSLIEKYNEDEGEANYPDGYTFTKGEMVKEFEDAAFSQEIGVVGKPIKTSYGYHIVLVTNREQKSLDDVKATLKSALFSGYMEKTFEEWKSAANIVKNDSVIASIK